MERSVMLYPSDVDTALLVTGFKLGLQGLSTEACQACSA